MKFRRGDAVWASFGSHGWSPRYVVKLGVRWVYIGRPVGSASLASCGRRRREELRPRAPALNGKDKPAPMNYEELVAIRDSYKARKADEGALEIAPEDR